MILKKSYQPLQPPPGAIPFKAWRQEEADRRGLTLSAFRMRYYRGQILKPEMIVQSQRVIWVKV